MSAWKGMVTFWVEGRKYTSYDDLVRTRQNNLCPHTIVRCMTSDKSILMTLGEIIQSDEECRAMPTAADIRSETKKFLNISQLFGTNPGRPGELVRLNRNDEVPIVIDVVPLDTERAKTVILREEGWTLRNVSHKCGGEEVPLAVRLDEKDHFVRYLGSEVVAGTWSVSSTSGFAIWQQPSCWGMICRREVKQRLHLRLKYEGDMYLVLLYDKTTGKHYLQQDCSFYQKVDGVVKMADIVGKSAWCAE